MRLTLLSLFFALFLCGCGDAPEEKTKPEEDPPSSEAGLSKGSALVLSLDGKVTVREKDGEKASPAELNQFLSAGVTLSTGPASNALLLLTNGTTLSVGPDTTLELKAFYQADFKSGDAKVGSLEEEASSSDVLLDLKAGDLVVDVKKLKKKSNFEISTPLGVAGIRGTSFKLLASAESTTLSVLTGQVDFVSPSKESFQVEASQGILSPKGGNPKLSPLTEAQKQAIKQAVDKAREKADEVELGTLKDGMGSVPPSHDSGKAVSAAIFEREFRRQLKKPDEELLPDDLNTLKSLHLNDAMVQDLAALSKVNGLAKVVLERNGVNDLSPLAQLPKLSQLSLISDSMNDLSPLAKLTNLTWLRLGGMGIKDLTPLASLVNLTELRLEENMADDFSFLQPLSKLQKLYLWGTEEKLSAQVAKIKEFLPQEKIVAFVVDASYSEVRQAGKPIEWNWEKKARTIQTRNVSDGIEVLDGKIYLLANKGKVGDSSAERYDPSKDQWEAITPLNVSRIETAAVSLGGKIYAIGGKDENGTVLSSVEIYDPNTDQWIMGGPLPIPIESAHAHNFNGKIILIPGKGVDGKILNQVFEFDPSTDKWSEKSPSGADRKATFQFSSVIFQGRIWVIGGSDEKGRIYPEKNWVYSYDPVTNVWMTEAPLTTPRRISYAWVANGNIYNASGYRSRDSIERYDPLTRRWTVAGSLPGSKYAAGAVVLGNKVYLVSGRTAHNFPTRDVYSADISPNPNSGQAKE